jgi:hypothetical protein
MNVHHKKALLFPALAGFPEATEDLADVPKTTGSVRSIEKVLNFPELVNLSGLKRLWCFGISPEKLQTISQCVTLTHLFIETVRANDLSPLARLRNLESLSIETAPKVEALDQFGDFDWLDGLALLHFPSVKSIEPLGRLSKIQALAIAGSMWTRMTIESLAPISSLKCLRFLHLTNLKAVDNSLEPLQELTTLEELECGNFFPMEQFARLAAALPQARCTWFSPLVSLGSLPCKKCGRTDLVLLTGKGATRLCRTCDEARVRKHEEAFHAMAGRKSQ